MTSGYLLDTNHLSAAARGRTVILQKINRLRSVGARVGVCVPVLCEIESGIVGLNRPEEYRRDLERVMRLLRIWPLDTDTARLYGLIHSDMRRLGRVLSQVDLMLAALARQMNLILATSDQDFVAVAGLARENWLA